MCIRDRPWTISNHPVAGGLERSFLPRITGDDQSRVRSESPDEDELTQQWKSGDDMVHSIVKALRDNGQPVDDEPVAQEDAEEDTSGNGSMINLNYLDLGSVERSPSSGENNNVEEVSSLPDGLDHILDQNDLFTEGTNRNLSFLGLLEED